MDTITVKEEISEDQLTMSAPKYKVIDVNSVISRKYAAGTTNIAINGVVARVVLNRCNVDEFLANKTKSLQSVDTNTRGKKRKLQDIKLEELQSEDANKSSLEPKKKRGRPKKLLQNKPEELETSDDSDTESYQPKTAKQRGKPRNSISTEKIEKTIVKAKHVPEPKQFHRLSANLSVEKRRFNGGSTSSDIGYTSTSRVRKPNCRLHDFVVSSTVVGYHSPSPINKPVKEVATTPKEKPFKKVNKNSTMDDPLKISTSDFKAINKSTVNEKPLKKVNKSAMDDPLKISTSDYKAVNKTPVNENPLKKVNKSAMDDPLKISTSDYKSVNKSTVNDALNTSRNRDDVVRSFLPVFNDPLQIDESDDMEGQSSKAKKFKEKENQVNNVQVKFSKNNFPKPKPLKSDQSEYSPPKLRSGNDTKSKIATPIPQNTVTELKISTPKPQNIVTESKISTPKPQNIVTESKISTPKPHITLIRQKKRTQSPAIHNNTVTQQKRQKLKDDKNSFGVKPNIVATKVACNVSKADAKMNGSNSAVKQDKTNAKYVLVDSDGVRNKNKSPKAGGDVDFNKLVRSLKLVKLPAANWKIRIVVSKQQTITEVTFTNKEINERCIKFSRTIAGYAITFGKSLVNLLGAPPKITSFNDVSILLDIVHNISLNDPVLEYSTSNNV